MCDSVDGKAERMKIGRRRRVDGRKLGDKEERGGNGRKNGHRKERCENGREEIADREEKEEKVIY